MLHQTTTLADLALGQLVLLALERVFPLLELDMDRGTHDLQRLAVVVHEVTLVRVRQILDLVAVNDDARRVITTGMGILELDATAAHQRQLVVLLRHVHDAGQQGGADAAGRRLIGLLHGFKQVAYATAVQRRDEVDAGEVDKTEAAIQLGLDLLFDILIQTIPLVDRDDDGATAVQNEAQQAQILIRDPLAGIDHQDHHVGIFDGLQRLDPRELLDRLVDFLLLAHPGGVDDDVLLIVALHRDIDGVAGGPRHVEDDDAIFTQHAVGQRGLTDVGATDDGKLDWQIGERLSIFILLFALFRSQLLELI